MHNLRLTRTTASQSQSSLLSFLDGGPISFGAKTHTLTAQSTVEAELMAISCGMKEAVYLVKSFCTISYP